MISDGHGQYLRRDAAGNYAPVKNKTFGDIYDQRVKASNVLTSCVSKILRDRYKVVEIDECSLPRKAESPQFIQVDMSAIKSNDKVAKRIGNETIEKNRISSLSDAINNIFEVISGAEQRGEELSTALSEVDQEIADIHHYIEFGKFNAYQGYLAFNMLKNRLKKRRQIKDELHILKQFGTCKLNSSTIASIKSEIENLNNRKYLPRKLNELFETEDKY